MADPDCGSELNQILPHVHGVFAADLVEKDLKCIKRIKKICSDTKQIVTNRELEIKDVVRGEEPVLTNMM